MPIQSLGYLGVRSDRLDDWTHFAGKILAMQLADHGGKHLSFRMDDLAQRLVVSDEPGETLAFIGWEVADRSDLEDYAARLDVAGHKVTPGARDLADRRRVEDLIVTHDPAGNRLELVWKPERLEAVSIGGPGADAGLAGTVAQVMAVLRRTGVLPAGAP